MTEARDLQVLTDPIGVFSCMGCGVKLDLAGRAAFSTVRCPSCRVEMQVPARMGGFILEEFLGAGGMGSAYRARDESLNRDAAIKIMRKSFGDDPKFVETFRREAQTAAKLNHPNVVQIYSFGEFKGQPFIVMELVTGGSLDRLIATGEPLDQTLVMRIGMEITSALQSGYQMQLVHGDIKPENILLDEKGAGKLVDFGIAQLAGVGGDSKEVWGTPYYVAPEKVRRQRTDCRADIYSLGGTLFHALAGKPPFDGPDATAVVKARFLYPAPPLRELRPDIDPEIESIVARMLQVEPSMRYPTYESLLGDMRRFLERAGPSAPSGKKVMILKKKGPGATGAVPATPPATVKTGPVSASAAVPAAGSAAPRQPGKFIITKKTVMAPNISRTTGELAGAAGGVPTGPHAAAAVPAARAGMPKSVIVLLVLLGVLLLGGLLAGVWLLARRGGGEKPAPPVSTNAVQPAQAAAVRQITDCLQQMQATSNLLSSTETARQLCEVANRAVTEVLGPEQHDIMIPLYTPAVIKPTFLPVPAPPVVAAALPAAGTNAAGTNAAAPEMELPPVAPPVAPPAVDPVREETLKEPVLVKVRDMYRARYRMEDIAAEATALFDEITAVNAVAATTPPATLSLYAMAFAEKIQSLTVGAKADEASRKLANIRHDLTTVSNLVAVIRKRLDKEAAAARVAADLEKQKQEAEKRESERQEKIKAEIAAITAKEAEINDLLHKHAYSDARRQLRTAYSALTEEESRKAYAVATQRVARLEGLRDFMIERVPGYQHPDGWKVASADRSGVVVRKGNTTTEVSWADIGDVRMVLFMRHYLMDEEVSRSLRLREHVRALINAAMYCRRFLPDRKGAQDFADKMLERAVSQLPDAREEIDLLLPGAGVKAEPETPADKPADKPAEPAAPK
jgi:hypothetical protein